MTLSMHLRRRVAVGLAAALFGATLLGGVAQVSADNGTDVTDQRAVAAERDRNVGRDIVGDNGTTMAPSTGEVQQAPSASDESATLPVQVINLSQNPDDRS
jgi:hypothetical protein